jgi:hypothetical protein
LIPPQRRPVGESKPTLDPMGDVPQLVAEVIASGLPSGTAAFLSVTLLFADSQVWKEAAAARMSGWDMAAFSTADGRMLRLSRTAEPTEAVLNRLRSDVAAFISRHGGTWVSMSIEEPQTPTLWKSLVDADREAVEEPPAVTSPGWDEAGQRHASK